MPDQSDKIQKVSIIVSRGSLEGIYPGLIMANGARMEGIEAISSMARTRAGLVWLYLPLLLAVFHGLTVLTQQIFQLGHLIIQYRRPISVGVDAERWRITSSAARSGSNSGQDCWWME